MIRGKCPRVNQGGCPMDNVQGEYVLRTLVLSIMMNRGTDVVRDLSC